MDPTRTDPLLAWLAFVHPAVIVVCLASALYVLNTGLAMRKLRLRRKASPPGTLRRHTRWALPTVWGIGLAFAAGPLSALLLRDWTPFSTFHAWVGLAAALCFGLAGLLGYRLKLKHSRRAQWHGLLGFLAVAIASVAAITGLELLP